MNPILIAAAAAALAADAARAGGAPPVVVEVSHGREVVSGGDDWSETALRLSSGGAPGPTVYLQGRHVRRFGAADVDFAAGVAGPLGGGWSGGAEAAVSPSPDFLPRLSAGAEVHRALGGGWVAGYGVRGAGYRQGTIWVQQAMVDRYFGDWLAAYVLTRADVPGGAAGHAHTLRGTRFYGGGSSATLGATAGREAELVGPGDTRVLEVRALAAWGAHRVDAETALTWALSWTRQGGARERTGIRVGVRRRLPW